MNEKKREGVYLNPDQIKLFHLLKNNSFDSSKWLSTKDISKKIKKSEKETNSLISSLKKTDGITISSTTQKIEKGGKVTKYGLAPETLEVLVRTGVPAPQKSDYNYCSLYLGKPALGTKAFDEKYTMKGLALALEVNGLSKEIREVDIQGGIVPTIPPYSSVSYLTALKFLGKTPRKNLKKTYSESILEEEIETEFERDFYKKYINNGKTKKITTLTEAFGESERQISTLMNTLSNDAILRLQLGFEERENIRFLEQAGIEELAEKKTERLNAMKKDILLESSEIYQKSYDFLMKRNLFNKISKSKRLQRKEGEGKENYFKRVLNSFEKREDGEWEERYFKRLFKRNEKNFSKVIEGLESLWSSYELAPKRFEHSVDKGMDIFEEVLRYSYYWSKRDPSKIGQKAKEMESELQKIPRARKDLESKIEDIKSMDSWTKQLLSGDRRAITRFTHQYPVDADSVELNWKKSKDKFTRHFFDWNIPNPMVVHVSQRKRVSVETGIINDIKTKEKDRVEVDYHTTFDGNKKIMLIENINHIYSNDVTANSIKQAKALLNYETMVLKKVYESKIKKISPDIVLLGAHMTGGFRAMPWFKESEQLMEGKFVEGQKIAWMVSLPTLQSIPNLEWLAAHNFRNWNVKEYLKGPYGSAAIVHAEDKEGVNKFWIMDTAYLEKAGIMAEEIETYRNELKNEKDPKMREKLLGLIKDTKANVKANFNVIEAAGDFHLGSPDSMERISKYQLIKAAQSYQFRKGLPNIVSYDEILNGVEEGIFKSSTRYEGKTPSQIEREFLLPTLNRTDLNEKEKLNLISKEMLNNLRSVPIHNTSSQKDDFDFAIKEAYLDPVLKKGGSVVFTDGNHHNHSQKLSSESQELGGRFDKSLIYGRYNPQGRIHLHAGRGNPVGVGTMILKGAAEQKLFTMHKFPTDKDEGYGSLVHLRGGKNDADIIIYGDRHQPIINYADAHLAVQHPGMEPINTYVPLIGKPAGIHGINNIFYDPDKRGIYRVDAILDNTLEKIIKTEGII